MEHMQRMMFSNAGLALSMTFKELNPYQVETLCETMYTEYERMAFDMPSNSKLNSLRLPEFTCLVVNGMRAFHIKQMKAQRVSYNSFCREQGLAASVRVRIPARQKNKLRKRHKQPPIDVSH